jgi:LPXTG-motif cell wall-anchored protein
MSELHTLSGRAGAARTVEEALMNRWMRALTVLALALSGAVLSAGASTAAEPDLTPCQAEAQGYSPSSPCQLTVQTQTQCTNNVPRIAYQAVVEGTNATTATITFINPTGADIVLTNQPLSGTLLWPGATVDADGNATDWPGWTQLASGEWIEGDSFDWARPNLAMQFAVNPVTDAVVVYPATKPACGPTGGASSAGVTQVSHGISRLSSTGTTVTPLLAVAGGLVVVGLGALLAVRRRRVIEH